MSDETRGAEPAVQLWTRDGFQGALSVVTRSTYAPDYLSVRRAARAAQGRSSSV